MNYQDMQTEEAQIKHAYPNGLSRDGFVIDGDILVTCWDCGELADPAYPEASIAFCSVCWQRSNERAREEMDICYCSICDGMGHGYPGGGPCPLETVGWLETLEEEAYERQMGVVSFADAMQEARYARTGGERLA